MILFDNADGVTLQPDTLSYLLFDLDGTLTDPKEGIVRSIQHALRQMGRTVPDSRDLEWCIGPPLRQFFPTLLDSTDENLVEQTIAFFRERFSTVGKYENQVYAGVDQMLARLVQKGYKLFLATAKARIYAQDILVHFDLAAYFAGIYGSELDGRLSNKNDLIRFILSQEAILPTQTIMIGDRHHDIEGAKANGILSGGVTYGYGSVDELTAAGADVLFDRPSAIAQFLSEGGYR
jgi:phosphoglycolate phosphatase